MLCPFAHTGCLLVVGGCSRRTCLHLNPPASSNLLPFPFPLLSSPSSLPPSLPTTIHQAVELSSDYPHPPARDAVILSSTTPVPSLRSALLHHSLQLRPDIQRRLLPPLRSFLQQPRSFSVCMRGCDLLPCSCFTSSSNVSLPQRRSFEYAIQLAY